jgi:triosephosphate isomerase
MKKLIIANWKCNPTNLAEAKRLFNKVKKTKAVICPPFVYLSSIQHPASSIQFGGQDCHWEQFGAYTGEVSSKMLKDLGCKYVIIGHSERRKYFKESDEIINKKLKAGLKVGLIPILCIGEKRGENPERVINNQLKKDLKGIIKKDLKKIIIAYEPVWAIGTGDFCPAHRAKKARDFIKKKLDNKVLYGGSVNGKVARNYIEVGFDGLLVGGASLNAKEFIKINKSA